MKIPLSKPWITEEDIKAVEEVMKTHYLSLGSKPLGTLCYRTMGRIGYD